MPVAPSTAVREGGFKYYGQHYFHWSQTVLAGSDKAIGIAYTAIANVLDYTAAAFPVMFGDVDLDHDAQSGRDLSPTGESIKQSCEYLMPLLFDCIDGLQIAKKTRTICQSACRYYVNDIKKSES